MQLRLLVRQILDKIISFETRLNTIESTIVQVRSGRIDEPRIANQAEQIGQKHKTQLRRKNERYLNENHYLLDFSSNLRQVGVTDSEETVRAIHVAMKAFPALEVTDARLMRVWRVMCWDHLHLTTLNVEMGWLGLRDWFPNLFAEECFNETLERSDLEASIGKMLELGDMPWAIYFRNCDRSFPESYLPSFLNWIDQFCKGGIVLFLIRCSGTNRCETNGDFYERVARLPEPDNPHLTSKSVNLRDSEIVLTLSEWEDWCHPHPDADSLFENQFAFLTQLESEIADKGIQVPMELLSEIQHYLRLSHEILAPTRAFDWALTVRFLPWIGNRHELIDVVQNWVKETNPELDHFQEGLQAARESDE